MSFRFYVGNYPAYFTREDLEQLFQDFDGLELDKICKKDKKCFCFFNCQDINVLVSVIQNMNDTEVAGRQLKVRAQGAELQDYVQVLIESQEEDVEHEVQDSREFQKKTGNNFANKSRDEKDSRRRFKEYSHTSPTKSLCSTSDQDETRSHFKKVSPPASTRSHGSQIDECSASQATDEYEDESFSWTHVKNVAKRYKYPDLVWLSMTNFPFQTSVSSIYQLVSDYDPVKVIIVCNNPSRFRALTEALIGFNDRKTADDVIMTFDNTIFRGRIILVNDAEDLTILDDLLDCFAENNQK